MKILCEATEISGNIATVTAPDGTQLAYQYAMNKQLSDMEYIEKDEAIEFSKILKLKEAGFDTDEIIKMKKEGLL